MAYSFATVKSPDMEQRHLNFLKRQNEQVGPIADIAHRNLLQMAQPPPRPAFGQEQGFQGFNAALPELSPPTLGGIAEAFAPMTPGPIPGQVLAPNLQQGAQAATQFFEPVAQGQGPQLTALDAALQEVGVSAELFNQETAKIRDFHERFPEGQFLTGLVDPRVMDVINRCYSLVLRIRNACE